MDNVIVLFINEYDVHFSLDIEWDDVEDRYYVKDVQVFEGVSDDGEFVYTSVDEVVTCLLNNELYDTMVEQLNGQTSYPDFD